MVFKHAIATITHAASRRQLLLAQQPACLDHVAVPRASSSSCSTASASASCRTPRATATQGSNTLGNIAPARSRCTLPTLRALGLGTRRRVRSAATPATAPASAPSAAWRRRRPGKDSVTGHWEMMGIVLDRPFPTFPARLSRRGHRRVRAPHRPRHRSATRPRRARRSSTSSAPEHMRTGAPIVYTSADSVFQIAAHEAVVPVPELYRVCEIAYELVGEGLGVGRVIARPFVGAPGHFTRTANRHDYALPPSGRDAARPADGSGDSGRRDRQDRGSVRRPRHHARRSTRRATMTAWTRSSGSCATVDAGFIFTNLVDFDTQYGHRNDVAGYAANLERFDARLGRAPADAARRRSARRHRRSRQRSDDAEHRSRARVRAGVRRRARACAPAPTSAPARRLPISARRSPRSSASARCARHELSGEITARARSRTCVGAQRRTIDDHHPRTARSSASARSSRRRRPRAPTRAAGCVRRRKTMSVRRFSAIATASSTARRSAG